MFRTTVRMLFAVLFAAAVCIGQPAQATQAASPGCSGYGCDGKYAYSVGCTVSYRVVNMSYIYDGAGNNIGYVQLWWSDTCQTNWARVVRTTSYTGYSLYASAIRLTDGVGYGASGGPGSSDVRTLMVYAPVAIVQACGFIGSYGACISG
ncbi:DUF2690 domain-containing protein [Chloroflexia bacterium SDU3-3]|nr:DUF2690 domain-containing protein [Chloroflexia bacterium SDU3-3]